MDLNLRSRRIGDMRPRCLAVAVLVMLAAAGCGAHAPILRLDRRLDAACGQHGLVAAPLPGQEGVYRAGPLTLAIGEDLAQTSRGAARGSEAIAVVSGMRPVTATVETGTPATIALQFSSPLTPQAAVGGDRRVRFPVCGGATRRYGGGIVFSGSGCARVRVTEPGAPAAELLIPIANSLQGCPASSRTHLSIAALPFLGVSCGRPDWIGCQRLGISATVEHATLVVVRIAGLLVTLTPPEAGAIGWLGYLDSADYRHGALAIPIARSTAHWDGTPEAWAMTTLDAFLPDGRHARISGSVLIHPGFG